jgi:hypothetical protein
MRQQLPIANQFSEQSGARASSLYRELAFALSRNERDTIKTWGARSSKRLLLLAAQRYLMLITDHSEFHAQLEIRICGNNC